MVRGLYIGNNKATEELMRQSAVYAVILILTVVLSVYGAVSSFIVPLKTLAAKLKSKATTAAAVRPQSLTCWST
jgi:hypothetical protein